MRYARNTLHVVGALGYGSFLEDGVRECVQRTLTYRNKGRYVYAVDYGCYVRQLTSDRDIFSQIVQPPKSADIDAVPVLCIT